VEEWIEKSFEVWSREGSRTVTGAVSGAFGIYPDARRDLPGWVVVHLDTGMSIGGWQPFRKAETAKEFVARIRLLAEWTNLDPERPPDALFEIQSILEELLVAEGQKVTV
jgi:hypothetical protein